jgi:glycosyltransferase involved in cell wall biosynthesis
MTRRRLSILLLYDGVYPETLGGVEMRNLDLAKALAARGHRVTLGGLTEGRPEAAAGVEIFSVGRSRARYNRRGRRSTAEALRMAVAASRLDLDRFDVVETANIPYVHLLPLAWRCRRRAKPLLVTWYEYWGRYWRGYLGPLVWLPYAAIEWLCARLGDRAVAVSRLTLDRLRARRRDATLLSIGIDLDAILASAADAPSGGTPLIYAGRLMAEKRVDLLLRALALLPGELRASGPLLTLIGDGPEEDRLRSLARELGVAEQVRFLGRLPRVQDVWRQLAGARVALQPSEREGFGIFALEAMAVGLPVVYCPSSENAVAEIVAAGVHGLAVEPTPQAFAEAVRRLLGDPDELGRLAANARRAAREYAWPNLARQFEEIALELLPATDGGVAV